MRKLTYRFAGFSFFDHTGIQHNLERMAEQGWMLERPGAYLWRYRPIPPQKLTFAVTYFPNASEFDPGPTEGQQVLQDYCEAAGWQHVTNWAQMQIFCTADEDPIPLETDARTQVDTIHTTMKKASLPGMLTMILLALFQLGFQCWQFDNDPIHYLSTPSYLLMVPAWCAILLSSLWELIFYFRWHKKALEQAASTGEFLPIRTNHRLGAVVLILSALIILSSLTLTSRRSSLFFILLWIAGMGFMTAMTNSVKKTLKNMNASRRTNRTVTMAVCLALTVAMMAGLVALTLRGFRSGWLLDEPPAEIYTFNGWEFEIYRHDIPLRVEDLTDTDYDHWSTEKRESASPLVSFREYSQRGRVGDPNIPDLEYDIVEVRLPALYQVCKKSLLERYWYNDPEEYRAIYVLQEDLTDLADQVYRYQWQDRFYDRYLFLWEERMAEVRFFQDPTPEQLQTAADILKTA